MPVKRCQRKGEKGWKWGDEGKCYIPSEEGSDAAAKRKAERQGRAIKSGENNAVPSPIYICSGGKELTLKSERIINTRTEVGHSCENENSLITEI